MVYFAIILQFIINIILKQRLKINLRGGKMSKKTILVAVGLIVVVLGVFSITKFTGNKNDDSKETIAVSHELGETSVIKNPQKVVVFDYGILDSLDTLGIEVTGLPKSSIPSFLDKYKDEKYVDLGTLQEPDMEKMYEIKPDLIIIGARQAKFYDELNKIAPTIHLGVDNTDYMGSFTNNMNTLGKLFGKEKEISKELKNIEANIKKVNDKAKTSGVNALITLANDGTFSVYGEGSRFGIIHKEFGVEAVDKTIEASTHGQKASFEYVVEKNPDYIFVVDRGAIVGGQTSAKELFENELVKKTDAYKNGKIVYLNPEIWYTSNGGFNSTQKMIDEVGSALEK